MDSSSTIWDQEANETIVITNCLEEVYQARKGEEAVAQMEGKQKRNAECELDDVQRSCIVDEHVELNGQHAEEELKKNHYKSSGGTCKSTQWMDL